MRSEVISDEVTSVFMLLEKGFAHLLCSFLSGGSFLGEIGSSRFFRFFTESFGYCVNALSKGLSMLLKVLLKMTDISMKA